MASFRVLYWVLPDPYFNDMVRVSKELGFVLFADDTNIFAEGRDPVELFGRVNGGLGELDRWFRCNSAIVHVQKRLPRSLNLEIAKRCSFIRLEDTASQI